MYVLSNDLYKFIRRINASTFDVRGRYTSLFYEVGEMLNFLFRWKFLSV